MSISDAPKKPAKQAQSREDRLKAALKANMGRRKAQARSRAQAQAEAKTGAQDRKTDSGNQ